MSARTITIWKKEVLGYATSARAYVLAALVLCFTAAIFWLSNLQEGHDASIRSVMGVMSFLLLAITPILTMRLLAEEQSRGTIELLMTSPVSELDIVLGKFLGALTLYLAIFVLSGIFPLVLLKFSSPEKGPMLAQYLGMLLCSGAFISVGLFASALTESQVIAAVVSYVLLLTFWIAAFFGEATGAGVASVLHSISLIPHLDNFGKGVIDAVDVFYYLAFTTVFLFLAFQRVAARRWA